MTKRIICAILSMCVLTSAAALCSCSGNTKTRSSSAAVEVETIPETEPMYRENGVGFNTDEDGNLTVVTVDSDKTDITIPSKVNGKKVVSVSRSAVKHSGVRSVTISKGITRIENFAFALCSELTEVKLPEGLESIGDNSFFACKKLSSVKLPSSLKTIGMYAFDACAVEKITIPAGVKEIGEYAFAECPSLKSFTLKSADTEVRDTILNESPNVEVTAPKGSPLISIAKKQDIKYTIK